MASFSANWHNRAMVSRTLLTLPSYLSLRFYCLKLRLPRVSRFTSTSSHDFKPRKSGSYHIRHGMLFLRDGNRSNGNIYSHYTIFSCPQNIHVLYAFWSYQVASTLDSGRWTTPMSIQFSPILLPFSNV